MSCDHDASDLIYDMEKYMLRRSKEKENSKILKMYRTLNNISIRNEGNKEFYLTVNKYVSDDELDNFDEDHKTPLADLSKDSARANSPSAKYTKSPLGDLSNLEGYQTDRPEKKLQYFENVGDLMDNFNVQCRNCITNFCKFEFELHMDGKNALRQYDYCFVVSISQKLILLGRIKHLEDKSIHIYPPTDKLEEQPRTPKIIYYYDLRSELLAMNYIIWFKVKSTKFNFSSSFVLNLNRKWLRFEKELIDIVMEVYRTVTFRDSILTKYFNFSRIKEEDLETAKCCYVMSSLLTKNVTSKFLFVLDLKDDIPNVQSYPVASIPLEDSFGCRQNFKNIVNHVRQFEDIENTLVISKCRIVC